MEEVKQHPRSKRKRKNINVYFNKTKKVQVRLNILQVNSKVINVTLMFL